MAKISATLLALLATHACALGTEPTNATSTPTAEEWLETSQPSVLSAATAVLQAVVMTPSPFRISVSGADASSSTQRFQAAQASAAVAGRPTFTVQSGDSLSAVLVREFGTYKRSLPLVKTLNPGLDVNQIRPGMRFVLPRTDEIPGGVSVAAAPPAVETAAPTPRREFIVR